MYTLPLPPRKPELITSRLRPSDTTTRIFLPPWLTSLTSGATASGCIKAPSTTHPTRVVHVCLSKAFVAQ